QLHPRVGAWGGPGHLRVGGGKPRHGRRGAGAPGGLAVHKGTPRSRLVALALNWLGLVDFAIALIIPTLRRRAPEFMGVSDPSRVALGSYPLVLIPAFAVANAFIMHGLSLWQLKRPRPSDMAECHLHPIVNGCDLLVSIVTLGARSRLPSIGFC